MLDKLSSALSRRRVLMGLGAACAAATATHEAGATAIAENPRLVALGDAVPTALKAYQDARARVAQIVAEWSPRWPTPDEKIVSFGSGCKTYRGLDGRGIEVQLRAWPFARTAQLGTPEYFEAQLANDLKKIARIAETKSQRGMKYAQLWAQRSRDAIEPARQYWSEAERITASSGIDPAQQAQRDAERALHALVSEVMAEPERTITGVVIKAQALTAWSAVDRVGQLTNIEAPEWAASLAASIMRQGGTA